MYGRYESSPTVIDCIFVGNSAGSRGGAMLNYSPASDVPTVSDCVFERNSADSGGAIFNPDLLLNCRFVENTAQNGGAVFGGKVMIGCTLLGNTADNGGAIYSWLFEPKLTNCLLSGNTALSQGGALYTYLASPELINCTITGNVADQGGGLISNEASEKLTNCILWDNRDNSGSDEYAQFYSGVNSWPTFNHNCVQGWTGLLGRSGGLGNFGDDPLFVDIDGPDDVFGTLDDNPRLNFASPCVDTGLNSALPPDTYDLDSDGDLLETLPFDLDQSPRIFIETVDRGAYEWIGQRFVFEHASVTVPEGGVATNSVSLAFDPLGPVSVTVNPIAGDPDIFVVSGAALSFDSSNFWVPQIVTLAADEDINLTNDVATIGVTASTVRALDFTAVESDNEPVPSVILVDQGAAAGLNIGTGWGDAFLELADALALSADRPGVSEIWIAAGTYTPAPPGGDRVSTFRLVNGVSIYGGFAGSEGFRDERIPGENETILSGDIGGDDGPDFSNVSENSYHVVIATDIDDSTILDALTISGGNADGIGFPEGANTSRGGGLYANDSSPILTRILFVRNRVVGKGGGMYTEGGSPSLSNCRFERNLGFGGYAVGGGLSTYDGNPTIIACTFADNASGSGGAMYCGARGSPALFNCRFVGNTARGVGGGIFNYAPLMLRNCVFSGNSADSSGGGIFDSSTEEVSLINCTLAGNSATQRGGGIWVDSGSRPRLVNCILWENSDSNGTVETSQIDYNTNSPTTIPTVNYSCVDGGWTGAGGQGNISINPLFVDAFGPDGVAGTLDDDLRIAKSSPAIDAGDTTALPADTADLDGDGDTSEPLPLDLAGNPRVVDDLQTPDSGVPGLLGVVDMGAYEFLVDCNENGRSDDQDLATGTSLDCTENLVPDECDIASGASLDTDGNGIPDECECFVASVALESAVGAKNRFLSFSTGDAGRLQAVRVTLSTLPMPYDLWNDARLWVGPPQQVSEAGASVPPVPEFPNMTAATLQCQPFYADWSKLGLVHVFHEGIVPDGTYSIQVLDNTCLPSIESRFSEPLHVVTPIWGDTVLDLSQTPPLPPNGPPVDIVDALAVLGAFSSAPGAITKARADLEPACVDLKINVTDVLSSLAGFVGLDYPFTPTAGDPCNSTCPNVLP